MATVLIGRQPICDRNLDTYGYELLYRSESWPANGILDGDQATASVAINTIYNIGLDRLVGQHRAFINMTRSFLVEGLYKALPSDRVILEVLEDVEPDGPALAAISEAASLGYGIALDDFVYAEKLEPLIELASVIKVETRALDRQGIAEHARILDRPGLLLLAEKVETQEEYTVCRDAGYDLFQGYFFCRPKVLRRKRIPTDHLALIRLTAALHDPEADIKEVERVVERNVSLSYMLLRIVNSSLHALPRRIESIRQAVVLLGLDMIQKCVSLLLMTTIGDKPRELMMTALVRARFCEQYAAFAEGRPSAKYFTVGLLSVVDALMDMSMKEVLDSVCLTDEIQAALIHREGVLGEALSAVVACEQSDARAFNGAPLDQGALQDCYFEALSWAFEVQKELAGLSGVAR
ncbi:MAG: HDOD domain-containing protein [Planctomycetes bacterium]|nr:HDOD domain-containing protein [Planctomycetota bacterium]